MTTTSKLLAIGALGAVVFSGGYALGVSEKPSQPLILPALADPTQLTVPFPEHNGMALCWSHGAPHQRGSTRGRYDYHWVDVQQAERRCGK